MSDKAVLITGGARRVGAALAVHFASAGYDVALHYNASEAEAKQMQTECRALGVQCEIFQQDLTDFSSLPKLISQAKQTFPHLGVLINNASVFERSEFLDTDEALFDRQFDANLKAPFFLTQAFAKQVGQGSVVNIVDTDIVTTNGSHFAYLMSKKSLADFTAMAARALGPAIRVNAVAPGCMLPSNQNEEDHEEKMRKLVPMKSHPLLEELCDTVQWLSAQPHITGQMMYVDGGKHLL